MLSLPDGEREGRREERVKSRVANRRHAALSIGFYHISNLRYTPNATIHSTNRFQRDFNLRPAIHHRVTAARNAIVKFIAVRRRYGIPRRIYADR